MSELKPDWQGQNKQCRQCTTPTPDNDLVEYGGYAVCKACNKSLSLPDLVYAMAIVSYADGTAVAIREIVKGLEIEIANATRRGDFFRDENAALRKELDKMKRPPLIGPV